MPNDSYAYIIVNVDEYLDSNNTVQIVNETLYSKEQIHILNTTESSTLNNQVDFAKIKEDFDTLSEKDEELSADFLIFSVTKIN